MVRWIEPAQNRDHSYRLLGLIRIERSGNDIAAFSESLVREILGLLFGGKSVRGPDVDPSRLSGIANCNVPTMRIELQIPHHLNRRKQSRRHTNSRQEKLAQPSFKPMMLIKGGIELPSAVSVALNVKNQSAGTRLN
jgi:hypothetical protein